MNAVHEPVNLANADRGKAAMSPRMVSGFGQHHSNEATAKQRKTLYSNSCQACHLPSVAELAADRQTKEPRYWAKSSAGMAFLKVTDINIQEIGTDPRAALDFRNRTADKSSTDCSGLLSCTACTTGRGVLATLGSGVGTAIGFCMGRTICSGAIVVSRRGR